VGDFALEPVAIDSQPIRNWNNLSKLKITDRQLARFRFVFDRNLIAGFHVEGSDVHATAVDLDVSVGNKLPRRVARIGEAKTINYVVQPGFEKLKKRFARHAALTKGMLENPAELALE